MNDIDKKRHALNTEQRTYREYLERRIPELHAEGKAKPPEGAGLIQSCGIRIRSSKFPGRVARDVAEAEYARGAR